MKKYYIMVELTFLKVLMLIRQVHQKSVLFVAIGNFRIKGLSFNRMHAVGVMMY